MSDTSKFVVVLVAIVAGFFSLAAYDGHQIAVLRQEVRNSAPTVTERPNDPRIDVVQAQVDAIARQVGVTTTTRPPGGVVGVASAVPAPMYAPSTPSSMPPAGAPRGE